VLRALANRLRGLVRPGDTLARFGSDELLMLCEGFSNEHEVLRLAEEALAAVHAPLEVAGRTLQLSASIGVALAGDGPGAGATLVRDTQTAMRRAQEQGGGRVAIFDPDLGERAHARLESEQDLRHVLSNGGLSVAYQPVVRLSDRAVVGLEALARMQVPGKGHHSPVHFIALAEEIGLVDRIGQAVLERACREATGFSGPAGPLQLAVNVSATELADAGLATRVGDVLGGGDLEPGRLCLEVTETALMAHPDECAATLRALKALGVTVAIDDFGTGHSSLAYLRRFPVDVLKVDRSFIAALGTTPTDATLVSGIVSLAHGLGHEVIAEGVETAHQLEYLSIIGADLAQGFYFSRPVPAAQLPRALSALGATRAA
jgi:EAL domain-containing protein (putative c-di-GMP-specific phosphodiesterase class I)